MISFPILGELGIEGNCFVPAKGTHQLASTATKTVFILSFYDLFSHFGGNGYPDSFYFILLQFIFPFWGNKG